MSAKNFFEFFQKLMSFFGLRCCGKGVRGEIPTHRYLTTEYTFIRYVPERGRKSQPSRMKVRQDPPAHPGYNGKQGGERFRTILKYPVATDMAMKRYRVNDTSLRSWRRTRQG